MRTRATLTGIGLGMLATLVTACSGGSGEATATRTVTVTAEPDTSAMIDPSADVTASSRAGTTANPTEGPSVLSTSASGRVLGLPDVFATVGEWQEDRYDVVSRTAVRGLGVTVDSCSEYSKDMLELRLARRFKTLAMNVSQANDSPSSDAILVVEVVANGKQQDLRRVPFDQTQPFQVSVQDVNALQIKLSLDESTCSSKEVIGVIEDLVVTGA